MLNYCILVFIACFVSDLSAKRIKLPDSVPRCYRNDPNLNDCMLKATETIRPSMISGIPELGLVGFEPYLVPSVGVVQVNKYLNVEITLTNLTIHGLTNYKFSSFSFDPKTLTWKMKGVLDKLDTNSYCDLKGKIFGNDLKGRGTVFATPEEATSFEATITSRLVKTKGVEHLQVVNVTSDFPIVKVKTRLENFEGISPRLLATLNTFIKDNYDDLAKEMSGALKEVIYSFVKNTYSSLSKKVAYDDMFPISDKFPPL